MTLAVLAGSDCERLRSALLAQPANAVSSGAFLAIGCWLIFRARRGAADPAVLLTGGPAMIAVGVGSVAYHGPQPGWADAVHAGAVAGLVAVVALHTARLSRQRTSRRAVLTAWRSAGMWMGLGLGAYVVGRSGSRWCSPASLWQPHAAWHILSAVALGRALRGYARHSVIGSTRPPAYDRPRR